MRIGLNTLFQSPKSKKAFEYSIDLSAEKVNYEFPFQAPILVKGSIADKSGAVFFDAVAYYTISVHCLRCNKPFDIEKQTEVHFLLSKARDKVDDEADDIYYLDTDDVDTDEIIVPEILMDMDMSYLCSEECKGLCPVCGCDKNKEQCTCDTKQIDPRLAKLAQLLESK